MTFDESERDDIAELIVARRILSTYFRINLSVADTLIPSILIARHHKKTHGIDKFARIAIVLNVDELNQISIQWDTSTSSKRWQAAG